MSLTGGHLDAFLEAGLTAEQIVALVKADIAEREKALAEKREKDAERQRRHRESRDVTVTDGDERDSADTGFLDKEKSPRPPKEINPSRAHTKRAGGKHPLPENWQPAPLKADGEAGKVVAAWPAGRMERELSKFKDHALQNRRLCSCWDAAWRNWIKQADEFDDRQPQRTNGMGRNQSSGDGLSSTARAALRVFGTG